jgi:hypothetical protein
MLLVMYAPPPPAAPACESVPPPEPPPPQAVTEIEVAPMGTTNVCREPVYEKVVESWHWENKRGTDKNTIRQKIKYECILILFII